jgi:hypothetical protein
VILLLPFPLFPLGTLPDLVIVLAPLPPAITGLPTPSLVWVSFAFLVRITGVSGSGLGSSSSDASLPLLTSSSSALWIITDRPDRPRGRVLGVRGCVLRVDITRGVGGGGCLGRKLE